MRDAGVELIEHSAHLAVMGFVEVIGTLRRHWSLLSGLKARFRSGNVAAVVLIDYPDFNMLVAGAAKDAGVPVIYYITPQVWAWRAGRLDTLARTVTKAAVILPFEEPLLREAQHRRHVRRPSAARSRRNAADARRGASDSSASRPMRRCSRCFPEVASRRSNITSTDSPAAALELKRRHPSLEVVVAAAPHVTIDPARWPFPDRAIGVVHAPARGGCGSVQEWNDHARGVGRGLPVRARVSYGAAELRDRAADRPD